MARGGVAYAFWTDDRDRSPGDSCPPPLHPGCTSGPAKPWKVYTSPLLLGGVVQESVAATVSHFCQDPGPRVLFDITWSTLVATDGPDTVVVKDPNGATYTGAAASGGTWHHVTVTAPCLVGTWIYTVESNKGAAVSRSGELLKYVGSCLSCAPCRPPRELE
jgi:hypothetical protein